MSPPAVFGITDDTLGLVVDLLLLFLVVLWLAVVYRVYTDAKRRLDDQMLIGCAVLAAVVFPFVGALVYAVVRPPEYLEEERERALELHAAELRVADLGSRLCPHCEQFVERDMLNCPHCTRRLRNQCACGKRALDPDWRVCPYCDDETGRVSTRPGRTAKAKGSSSSSEGDAKGDRSSTRRQAARTPAAELAAAESAVEADEELAPTARSRPGDGN